MAPPAPRNSAVSPCFHGCLALLHRHFPPGSPPSNPLHPSLHSQQRPSPWDCSTIPKLHSQALGLPGDPHSCLCVCGRSKVCLLLIPFGLPQTSRFTLSLKCLSSDADNCLDVRTGPLLQFSDPLRAGPVLLTLLFLPLVPSSYQVLGGSRYSLPLGRSSCPHSAGVLHAFPCLKACS